MDGLCHQRAERTTESGRGLSAGALSLADRTPFQTLEERRSDRRIAQRQAVADSLRSLWQALGHGRATLDPTHQLLEVCRPQPAQGVPHPARPRLAFSHGRARWPLGLYDIGNYRPLSCGWLSHKQKKKGAVYLSVIAQLDRI